jgi:DNA-binding HxlR family transcriptional regulator
MDKNDSKRSQREGGCPVLAFQKMVSGKYKIRILWDLKDGARRYGEIRTGLLRGAAGSAEVAPRVLSRELKALADFGLSRARTTAPCRPRSSIG